MPSLRVLDAIWLRIQADIDLRYVISNVNEILSKNDIRTQARICESDCKHLALAAMSTAPIPSPCIQVCAVSGETGLCIGCGRTLAEIAGWRALDDARRLAIMAELPARLAATQEKRP